MAKRQIDVILVSRKDLRLFQERLSGKTYRAIAEAEGIPYQRARDGSERALRAVLKYSGCEQEIRAVDQFFQHSTPEAIEVWRNAIARLEATLETTAPPPVWIILTD